MWLAQGDVDVFHTHVCFIHVCMNWLSSTTRLLFGVLCGRPWVMMLYTAPFYVLEPVCMNKLLETILLLLGLHQWSARGDVDMFHTYICFELVCLTRMLLTMYFRLGLPRSWPRVVLMCYTPMYALQLVYMDWLFLTTPLFFRLALQLVLGDNGALHTHVCYEPDCFHGPCC